MVTKAIVEQVLSPYKVKIRIPIFDGIDSAKQDIGSFVLSEAIICSLPNTLNFVQKGDIVIICFEDNDIGKPIILGHLLCKNENDNNIILNARNINISDTTKLSSDTTIGDIQPTEISYLSGVKSNIQTQINYLINNVEETKNNYISLGGTQQLLSSKTLESDNLDFRLKGTGSSTSAWQGRIVAGGNTSAFIIGEYNSLAGLGAHNAALNQWAPLYINPDGAEKVSIGKRTTATGWTDGCGILEIINSTDTIHILDWNITQDSQGSLIFTHV